MLGKAPLADAPKSPQAIHTAVVRKSNGKVSAFKGIKPGVTGFGSTSAAARREYVSCASKALSFLLYPCGHEC
jgi:hypothetical protein